MRRHRAVWTSTRCDTYVRGGSKLEHSSGERGEANDASLHGGGREGEKIDRGEWDDHGEQGLFSSHPDGP